MSEKDEKELPLGEFMNMQTVYTCCSLTNATAPNRGLSQLYPLFM